VKPQKITETDVRQAWAELLGPRPPLVPSAGMTVHQLMTLWALPEQTVRNKLRELRMLHKVRIIGVRPTRFHPAVYEIVEH
jgi:hypothetical protein